MCVYKQIWPIKTIIKLILKHNSENERGIFRAIRAGIFSKHP